MEEIGEVFATTASNASPAAEASNPLAVGRVIRGMAVRVEEFDGDAEPAEVSLAALKGMLASDDPRSPASSAKGVVVRRTAARAERFGEDGRAVQLEAISDDALAPEAPVLLADFAAPNPSTAGDAICGRAAKVKKFEEDASAVRLETISEDSLLPEIPLSAADAAPLASAVGAAICGIAAKTETFDEDGRLVQVEAVFEDLLAVEVAAFPTIDAASCS